ncbi:hypothetical protein BGW80DRAFT_1258329 [Lactifluus volemus]|nr:hypothetical protein BGW80DRAFT_1258329 [Lactifluus volemus]
MQDIWLIFTDKATVKFLKKDGKAEQISKKIKQGVKHIGSPAAERLNVVPRPALRGEKGGATRVQEVTAEGTGEEGVKAVQVPCMGGNREERVQPQIGMKRRAGVAAVKIPTEDWEGIHRKIRKSSDEDNVAFEESISFVTRQMIRESVREEGDGSTQNALTGRPLRGSVAINEFTKLMKAKETTDSERKEKEVIMGSRRKRGGKAAESTRNKGMATGDANVGESNLELVTNAGEARVRGVRL